MTTPPPPEVAPPKRAPKQRNLWCAYHSDLSDFAVFGRELDALRYAAQHNMQCKALTYGESVRDQLG